MKKIIIVFLLCGFIVPGNAQASYDTVYFRSNKIEIIDTGFKKILSSVIEEDTICMHFQKYNTYSVIVEKTDSVIDIHITMVPRVLKWASKAAGYFFIGKTLFFIDGDLAEDFANITSSQKRFYYKIPNPNAWPFDPEACVQEFCVIMLRFENNKWHFVEERENY